MPAPDTTNWAMVYEDPRSDTRFLFSIPTPMLRDIRVLAKSRGIGVSQMLRIMVTEEVADFVRDNPDLAVSFKGRLPMPSPPGGEDPAP